jgi:ubiquinol-cytochrome c reductase core subunit 2
MNGRYTDPHTAADSVDKITGDDVVQLAKKIFGGKPTFAAQGNLYCTPWLDELKS